MKINRQGKSRTLSTEELDLVNNYLPTEKHKLISLVLRKTAGRISEVAAGIGICLLAMIIDRISLAWTKKQRDALGI